MRWEKTVWSPISPLLKSKYLKQFEPFRRSVLNLNLLYFQILIYSIFSSTAQSIGPCGWVGCKGVVLNLSTMPDNSSQVSFGWRSIHVNYIIPADLWICHFKCKLKPPHITKFNIIFSVHYIGGFWTEWWTPNQDSNREVSKNWLICNSKAKNQNQAVVHNVKGKVQIRVQNTQGRVLESGVHVIRNIRRGW